MNTTGCQLPHLPSKIAPQESSSSLHTHLLLLRRSLLQLLLYNARNYTSIHRSSKSSDITTVGNNNLIMGSCHIAHDCKIGNNIIFANNTLLAGHVVVEDHAHTAGAVVVHQFCHVGSFSFIGGGPVIAQDVPKYIVLRGLNLEGLRRNGFTAAEIRSLRTAYQKIFMPADKNCGDFEERFSAHIPAVHSMVQSIRDLFEGKQSRICKFRH